MIEVPLRDRAGVVAHALLDDADRDLAAFRWHLNRSGYVVRSEWLGDDRRRCRTVYLHREVLARMGFSDAPEGDHRDRDKFNCCRSNLRPSNRRHNNQNRGTCGAAGYRGVTLWRGRFRASVHLNGQRHHLGMFDTAEEAGRAADRFRLLHMPGALPAFVVEDRAA